MRFFAWKTFDNKSFGMLKIESIIHVVGDKFSLCRIIVYYTA